MSDGTVVNRPTASPNLPQIPGCKLIAIAGQGGMGTVYRAEQLSPRRIVAVKVLTRPSAGEASLAAFRREAETIAHLEHPNILPVYGFGEVNGQPYLVLRYLAGGSVALRLRRGKLELPAVVRWARAVAAALDMAHGRGLVHRDVKPSNILLDEAGNAYLTDFGIAAAMAAAGDETVIGSAAYMSPEQGRGEPVDRRADIYALAVSVFEMLTGEKPYSAETALGMIVRHINDPIPSARELNPGVPAAVDAVIRRGMAKEPAERPQTAGEFAALLAQAAGQPAEALPVAGAGRVQSPTIIVPPVAPVAPPVALPAPATRRINPIVWAGIALVAVCLLGAVLLSGGGLAAIFLNRTATPRPSSTVPPTATALPTAAITPLPEGQLLAADFSTSDNGFGVRKADASGEVAHADGALRMTVLKTGAEFYSPSGKLNVQDVIIDVDLQQTAGPESTEFGGICRWQDKDNYSAFGISAGGQFKIWQKTNGATLRLIDWTDAPSLAGAGLSPHHLTITCSGARLGLEVDGVLLGQAEDPAPAPGDVVLFAGLRDAGSLVVDFTKVLVQAP